MSTSLAPQRQFCAHERSLAYPASLLMETVPALWTSDVENKLKTRKMRINRCEDCDGSNIAKAPTRFGGARKHGRKKTRKGGLDVLKGALRLKCVLLLQSETSQRHIR